MDTQSREVNLDWIPASGFQLRKAGVQFDAARVDGDDGRRLADLLETMTGGDPGPVVIEDYARRSVYFLLPAGSTSHRPWPPGVTRLNSGPSHVSYVPVPALRGRTWPLSWRFPPSGPGRFVHPLLLLNAAALLLK
ncbi:hypothetical protein OG883_33455 [Streptomyces sp. NBC_01142]|uniref:hypothetical protein n=1 Tax=Streptomyces sp. NBC_01142 TaxID=2975865 RepID=UPI00224E8BB8|nr:hypothetical protein [Streptomyces sp. NBC_01142]MCX4824678.1 hypothetical protein [Streptomyces sp. NBC_01142]